MNITEKPRFFAEPVLSVVMTLFAEFTLSDKTRFFAPLRMTGEGLRMTGEGFRMANTAPHLL